MRLAAFTILCLVGGFAALAAPAPPPRPWVEGWKEVDPDGDCKFVRKRESLTIEIPGKVHSFGGPRSTWNAPHLSRKLQGDFVAQVRVRGGDFLTVQGPGTVQFATAGLFITDGNTWAILTKDWSRDTQEQDDSHAHWFVGAKVNLVDGRSVWRTSGGDSAAVGKKDEIYLRLVRKGNDLYPAVSEDGKMWQQLKPFARAMPKALKLGVIATNPLGQPFRSTFDFKLTLTGPKGGAATRRTP
jgi:regulation of enolase protein 1 (concanavalin A-like superfamily)